MYIIIGTVVFILDFLSKMLVKSNMEIGESIKIIDKFFSLTYIQNRGMAWGLLQNQRWIFILATFVIIGLMLFYVWKNKPCHFTAKLGVSLSVAGALGNLVDRLFYGGGVVDFFRFEFIDFPIFNVADIAVCLGMGILAVYMIFFEGNGRDR